MRNAATTQEFQPPRAGSRTSMPPLGLDL